MKNKLLFLILLLSTTGAYCQAWQWVNSGGSASQSSQSPETAYSVALDSMGNSYVTGRVHNSPNFGGGPMTGHGQNDIFIAKYDCEGTRQWVKLQGGTANDEARCIKADAHGNIYVLAALASSTATFGNTVYTPVGGYALAKYDSNGDLVWVKFGSPGVSTFGGFDLLEIDKEGNIVIAAQTNSGTNFHGYVLSGGSFIAKYTSSGDLLWAKNANLNYMGGGLSLHAITTDAQSNIYVGGSIADTVIIGGEKVYPVGASFNFFLSKFDSNGNFIWVKTGQSGRDNITSIKTDRQGNVHICGSFAYPGIFGQDTITGTGLQVKPYVANLDSMGNFMWATGATGQYNFSCIGLSIDHIGNTYITGQQVGPANFGNNVTLGANLGSNDVFIASFDSSGTARWAHQLLATGSSDQGYSTAVNERGDLYVAGSFSGTMTLGSNTATASGPTDIFVAKFGSSCAGPAILPPTAPVQLAVSSSTGQSAIELSWQHVGVTENGFRIYRSATGGAWNLIDSVGANATTYLDASVQNNTLYCYRVAAFNNAGNSIFSNAECEQIISGIADALAVQQLQLYPNPSTGNFTIAASAAEATEASLVITSITGQQVLQQRLSLQQGDNQLSVALPVIAKGLYLVQVQSGSGVITRRLVVE